MNKLNNAQLELREMDELAAGSSPVHRLNPLCKLLVTVFYIAVLVSFPKYDLSALVVMVLYPVLLFQAAGIPVGLCFHKLRIVLPLVCAVGLVNPFVDHTPLLGLGGIVITGGMVSMVTLMLKGVFSLMASFLLIATTSIDTLCAALRMLHVPDILVTLLLLTYRYIGVMMEEVAVMSEAYSLRAPGQKGIHISAWGSFWGSCCCGAWIGRRRCTTVCCYGASGESITTLRCQNAAFPALGLRLFAVWPLCAPGGSIFRRCWADCL